MKNLNILLHKNKSTLLLFCITVLGLILSTISLARYNAGQMFYYDFGIFAHTIFQLSRFQVPYINHLVLGNVMFLGDHFNPSLILIAPLFWITSDLRILLLEQSFAIAASTALVFLIAYKSRLPLISASALAIAYGVFAGTLNPLVTDWHPESTAAACLLLFIYLLRFTQKKYLALIVYIIFLGFKESNALSGVFVLFWMFCVYKDLRKITAAYAISSIIYMALITRLVIPYIAQHSYLYTPNIPNNPLTLVSNYANSETKQKLIRDSMSAFGGLPLLSGWAITMPFAELGIRLAPNGTVFNNLTLGQHYNVLLGIMLVLSTYQSLMIIHSKSKNKFYITHLVSIFLILCSLYVARKFTASPINVVINKAFYTTWQGDQSLNAALKVVPATGSVMSHNNLLAYTANRREKLYQMEVGYGAKKPDIIFFNLTDGANINNYYGSSKETTIQVKDLLKEDPSYQEVGKFGDYYVYTKK